LTLDLIKDSFGVLGDVSQVLVIALLAKLPLIALIVQFTTAGFIRGRGVVFITDAPLLTAAFYFSIVLCPLLIPSIPFLLDLIPAGLLLLTPFFRSLTGTVAERLTDTSVVRVCGNTFSVILISGFY